MWQANLVAVEIRRSPTHVGCVALDDLQGEPATEVAKERRGVSTSHELHHHAEVFDARSVCPKVLHNVLVGEVAQELNLALERTRFSRLPRGADLQIHLLHREERTSVCVETLVHRPERTSP